MALETAEAVDSPSWRAITPLNRGVNESRPGARWSLNRARRIALAPFRLHIFFA
jgi:hypothetical protein